MTWYSQLGQDAWVSETLGGKRAGFFVDVGAADGVVLSNTCALEREFGWTGIAIEPHDGYFAELAKSRACTCVNALVMGDVRTVAFREAGLLSGAQEAFNAATLARLQVEGVADGQIVVKTSRTLGEILAACNAPPVIDFLSLDTEGTEFEILAAFPFARHVFRTICVEHNGFPEPMRALRALLAAHGYTLAVPGAQDDYWTGPC